MFYFIQMLLLLIMLEPAMAFAENNPLWPLENQTLNCVVTAKQYCAPDGICQIPGPLQVANDIIKYDGKADGFAN